MVCFKSLECRTCLDKSLTGTIGLVLVEVLDETGCEIFCFLFPFCCILVGVTRIEDTGVNTFELCRNGEVEVRDDLGGSLVDCAAEDGIDDTTGVADGDTLAGTIPAGVHQVCLCTATLHLLYELFCVLGRMELKEGLAEAGAGGRLFVLGYYFDRGCTVTWRRE